MKQKMIFITITSIFLIGAFVFAARMLQPKAAADAQAIYAANQLYQVGNYDDAIRIYEQIIDQGVEDSTLYYNLGNSYYGKGDLGRAILNYQRAATLDPRDADIQNNLEIARTQANAVVGDMAPGPLGILRDLTGKWLTLNETALLTMAIWFVIAILFIAWRLQEQGLARKITRNMMLFLFLVLTIAGLSLGSRLVSEQMLPEGVVIAPVVAVSIEPGEQSEVAFNLQNGAEVNLMETNGDWARLEVPGSQIEGWVPLDSVETVASGNRTHEYLL